MLCLYFCNIVLLLSEFKFNYGEFCKSTELKKKKKKKLTRFVIIIN